MLLMIEKGIRGGICSAIHRYGKASNKYVKNYDKNIESSHLVHLDAKMLYGRGMSKNLLVNVFKWAKNENFIKHYDDKGYILEVDVEYPKNLFNLHSDLPFLSERKRRNQLASEPNYHKKNTSPKIC